MKGTRAAVRYAKSLMQIAQEQGNTVKVLADMKVVEQAIDESKELSILLRSPLVKSDQKQIILNKIFAAKVSDLTVKFLDYVVKQKRESILKTIAASFITLYNKNANIAEVEIITARPLSAKMKDEVLSELKSQYSFSSVELEESVDQELIGGMILRIGDKQIDGSIKRKLKDIENELVKA